jgi:hypothetical protein
MRAAGTSRRAGTWTLAIAVCVPISGCGTHAKPGGDASPPAETSAGDAPAGELSVDATMSFDADPSTPLGYCQGYLEVLSEVIATCDGISLADARALFASSTAPCDRFAADLAAGRLSFDGTHARTCLDLLRTVVTCPGAQTMPQTMQQMMQQATECATLTTPRVPVGGSCTSLYIVTLGEQCENGSTCVEAASYACTGVCTVRTPVGSPCVPLSTRCASGASCNSVSKTCVMPPPSGSAGASCDSATYGSCTRDLYCDTTGADASTHGTCRAKKTSGACLSNTECADPRSCVGMVGAKTCALPKHAGDACTVGLRECDLVSHCGADGKCTSARAALGQPCGSMNGETISCVDGAMCDAPILGAGTCAARKHAGDACTGVSLDECDGNNGHCDATTHLCVSCPP